MSCFGNALDKKKATMWQKNFRRTYTLPREPNRSMVTMY